VEIDSRATDDALGRLATSVQAGIEDLSDFVSSSFDSLHDAIFGMEDAEEASASVDVLSGSMVEAAESADQLEAALHPIAVGQSPSVLLMLQQGAQYAGRGLTELAFAQVGLLKPSEDLEAVTTRLAFSMGGSGKEANELADGILDLTLSTHYSLESVSELATGLGETGQTLGSFSADTQTAMANLNTVFGVTGQESGRMVAQLRGMGTDLPNLLGEATAFTKSFGLPGVFKALPEVITGARNSVLRFGSAIVGSGAQIIRSTIATGMAFTKTFGTTVAESVAKAQEAMDKFAGQAQQDRRVFLGMGTEFSGLTMAIMQTGRGIHQSMELVRAGADGGTDAALALGEVFDGIRNPFMKERFAEQLRDELTPEMFALATNALGARDSFLDAEAAAARFNSTTGGQGVAAFNELGKGVMGVTSELRKMLGNMFEFTKAVLGNVAISVGLPEILKGITATVAGLAERLRAFTQSNEFKATLEEWKPTIISVGKAVLGFAAIAGPAFSALGSGLVALRMIPGLETLVSKFGGVVGRIFGKVGPIGLAIGAFMGLKSAVMEMGETLGDPNATGMEKFESLIRGVGKGVGKFFDTMLLGIPSMIVEQFFPDLEMKFDSGVSGFIDWLSPYFAGGFEGVFDRVSQTVGGWLSSLGSFMLDHLPDIKSFMSTLGKNVGASMGGLIRFVGETVWSLWEAEWAIMKLLFFGTGVEGGEGISEGLMSGLEGLAASTQVIWEGVKSYVISFLDGFLGSFGSSTKEISLYFQIAWESIAAKADWAWTRIKNGVNNIADVTAMALSLLVEDAEVKWAKFIGFGKLAGAAILSYLTLDFKTLGGAIAAALSGPFATLKAVALGVIQFIKDALYDMAVSTVSTFLRMFTPLGGIVPGMTAVNEKLEETKTSVAETQRTERAAAREQIKIAEERAAAAEVTLQTATRGSGNRLLAIQAETDAEVKGIRERAQAERDFLAGNILKRTAAAEAEDAAHTTKMGNLQQQLSAAADTRERQQEQNTEARRFREEARTQLEQTLQTVGEASTRQNATDASTREATNGLRAFMQDQTTAIANEVAAGALTMEQANARLQEAAARASTEALEKLRREQRAPAAVAEAANGPAAAGPTPGGLNAEAVQLLLRNFRGETAAAVQKQVITLRGDAAMSRAAARGATIANANSNGPG
jgi:hypothetical protein